MSSELNPADKTVSMFSAPSAEGSIGPYRLLRKLGEGGMGIVYHAQQTQPLRRDVALKVIKPGMDSKHIIARFEGERQALAIMDHPNIARVFDAGMTEAGLPYFVMEMVDGTPITAYCDKKRLTLQERIALFIPVCRAIQHAHQKGIIHRDIKPSNVMVEERDGKPVPKVIDFGLAKALASQMNDATMMTGLGMVVGTLEYMSPEQAELGKQDIDTRSDVYSLGVLLYELVTGTTPLEHESLAKENYIEILKRIRDEEPVQPSTRIRKSNQSAELAQRRRSDPALYRKLLHGELDWMVMKALEKDRNRRYETANGLARDLERYLAGEALEAAPPSTTYRLGKLVRKHRMWLATGSAFALLLLMGVVVSSWMAMRAIRAEQQAVIERNAATSVNDFLQNDLLAQASVVSQAGREVKPDPDLKVRTALDRAAARIDGKFGKQPQVEASIRQTIGVTYQRLGLYGEAQRHLERALVIRRETLGENHADTAKAMRLVAGASWEQGNYSEAETMTAKALDIQRKLFGEDHAEVLSSLDMLAASVAYQGKYAKAEGLFEKILANKQRVLGEEHVSTLTCMNNLAATYYRLGKYEKAAALHTKSLAIRRKKAGDEHPSTILSMSNLGEVYQAEGKYGAAEELYVKSLEIRRRVLGEVHPDTLTSERNLGSLRLAEGKLAEAAPLLIRALEGRKRVLGEEHPKALASVRDLAGLRQAEGKYAEAERLLEKAYEVQKRILGARHPDSVEMAGMLGELRLQQQLSGQAEGLLRESLRVYAETMPVSWQRYKLQMFLGISLAGQGKNAEAEPLLLAGFQGWSGLGGALPAAERSLATRVLGEIARMYERWGKPDKAKEWRGKPVG